LFLDDWVLTKMLKHFSAGWDGRAMEEGDDGNLFVEAERHCLNNTNGLSGLRLVSWVGELDDDVAGGQGDHRAFMRDDIIFLPKKRDFHFATFNETTNTTFPLLSSFLPSLFRCLRDINGEEHDLVQAIH